MVQRLLASMSIKKQDKARSKELSRFAIALYLPISAFIFIFLIYSVGLTDRLNQNNSYFNKVQHLRLLWCISATILSVTMITIIHYCLYLLKKFFNKQIFLFPLLFIVVPFVLICFFIYLFSLDAGQFDTQFLYITLFSPINPMTTIQILNISSTIIIVLIAMASLTCVTVSNGSPAYHETVMFEKFYHLNILIGASAAFLIFGIFEVYCLYDWVLTENTPCCSHCDLQYYMRRMPLIAGIIYTLIMMIVFIPVLVYNSIALNELILTKARRIRGFNRIDWEKNHNISSHSFSFLFQTLSILSPAIAALIGKYLP